MSFTHSGDIFGKATQHLLNLPGKLFYSAGSIAEIKLKEAIKAKTLMSDQAVDGLIALGINELALESRSAARITRFPALVRHDPFDRLLLAQAVNNNLLFITADRRLLELELEFVHDARL